MFKKIYLIPLTALCFLICSCADEAKDKEGVSDGGGGIVGGSTIAQVERAVLEAKELILDPRFRYYFSIAAQGYAYDENQSYKLPVKPCKDMDIYCANQERMQYFDLQAEHMKKDGEALEAWRELNERSGLQLVEISEASQERARELAKKHKKLSEAEATWAINRDEFAKYVKAIPLDLVKNDSCYYGNRQKADASVTALNKSARVCFSLKNLQRIPIASLGKHIVSLWMHELAHMEGYSEKQAKVLEELAVISYEKYLSSTTDMFVAFNDLNQSLMKLDRALYVASQDFDKLNEKQPLESIEIRSIYYNIVKAHEHVGDYMRGSTPTHNGKPFLTHVLYTENTAYEKDLNETRALAISIHERLEKTFKVSENMKYPESLSFEEAKDVIHDIQSELAPMYFRFLEASLRGLCGKDLSLTGDNTDPDKSFFCSKYE